MPRIISRPFSKLNRLCAEAARRTGELKTFAAVAEALGVSPGRVTQMFGHGQETNGVVVNADTVGKLVAAFAKARVPIKIDWLYLDYKEFAKLVARCGEDGAELRAPSGDWELREGSVLADLVELRLHPPRPANEVPDSHVVEATLLFGTAKVEYEPEDETEERRTISIALKDARMAIGSDGYRPLPGTVLGEKGREAEHLRRVAGGIEISGPAASNGTLEGDPLDGQPLATIAGTHAGDDAFEVTVAAGHGSFVVAEPDAPAGRNTPSVNKNAILNRFIHSRAKTRDDANRAVLARATAKRKAEGGGDGA